MALDLFKLLGTIEVDNSKANDALDETSNKGEKAQSKLSRAFGAIGKGAVAVGKTIATGLAVGGAAFAGLTMKALSAAGELEQNMGGSEAVFGEYAGKMQETAKSAFSNMGLSTSDYLATANKMGALFQGAGFDIEESMNLSSDAMQRAADVASIMGIDTGAAMEAIAGAAKGNFTMMDNLGVAMNDTTLQAYALSKGIDKTTGEMTNQEKISLAMEMFMEKTAYAAGNYAKENETLAGSLGTAKAALTNFLDGSGSVEDLVSSLGNLANVAVKSLKEILPRLTTGLKDLVNQIMPMIPPLLESLLPSIIEGAVSLIGGLASALPSILDVLVNTAIPKLLSGIVTIFETLISALPGLVESICSALPTLIPLLINGLVSMIVTLCNQFAAIIKPIIDHLPSIIMSIVDAVVDNLPILIDGAIALVMGIVSALPVICQALADSAPVIIEKVVTGLLKALPQLIAGVGQLVVGLAKAIPQILQSLWDALVGVFKGIWAAIQNVFPGVAEWFGNVFSSAKDAIQNAWSGVKNFFSNIWSGIKNVFSNVGSWFGNIFTSAKNGIQNAWSGVKNFFSNIKNGIVNAFSNVKEKLTAPFTKARDAIKGVVDKIKGFFSGLKLKFPNIKLPHFRVSPSGWEIGDLLKGSIPKLGIDWYAKAMDNPIVMNKPTIWGYDPETGNLRGGGEAGTEVVSGANTLMNMIQTSVAGQNAAIADYLQRLVEILADYFPQILEGMERPRPAVLGDPNYFAEQMAIPMNNALGKLSSRKDRGR